MTLIVDTVRRLPLGLPVGDTGWYAVICWVAILGVAAPMATRLHHRRFACGPKPARPPFARQRATITQTGRILAGILPEIAEAKRRNCCYN